MSLATRPVLAVFRAIVDTVATVSPQTIWPVTVAGWVALALSVGAGVGSFIAWGKLLEKINGYGSRLKTVEESIVAIQTTQTQQTLALERVTASQEGILRQLGAAEKAAQGCGEDMGEYAREIGSKMDEWRREIVGKVEELRSEFHKVDKELSSKLEGLEREVRLTRTTGRGD